MATPQWENLKAYIYGLDGSRLPLAAKALNVAIDARDTTARQCSKVCQAAYQLSKSRAGNYGNIGASYDATAEMVRAFVAQAMGARGDDSDTKSASTADTSQEATREPDTAEEAKAAPIGEGAADLLEKLAKAYEERMKKAGAITLDEVRGLCREAVKELPPLKVQVTRDGAVIGEVNGRQHKQFAALLKAATVRQSNGFYPNIWLAGPAGSGKTTAAENVAKATGRVFEFNGALSMSHEVLGFRDGNGQYHDTAFRRAFVSPSVYLFDECDGCADNSPLLALNAALANGAASFPDGMVTRHPDSLIMAGANTFGLGATSDYVGRAKIDGAFLDRFAVKLFWQYDEELEAAISGNPSWARTVQRARKAATAAGLKVLITPRASIAGAALLAAGFSEAEAKAMTYQASLTPEQARIIG